MILLNVPKSLALLAANMRALRIGVDLTQEGLAKRAGVPLPTLRKFEQKGLISLEAFLKIAMVLGVLDRIIQSTETNSEQFSSIDDVLKDSVQKQKKRGHRK